MSTTISAENPIDRDHHQDTVRLERFASPGARIRSGADADRDRDGRNRRRREPPLAQRRDVRSSAGGAVRSLRRQFIGRSRHLHLEGRPSTGTSTIRTSGSPSARRGQATSSNSRSARARSRSPSPASYLPITLPITRPAICGYATTESRSPAQASPSTARQLTPSAATTMSEADRGIVIGLGSGESAVLSVSENLITGAFLSSLTGVAATIGDGAGSTGTLNVNVGAFNVTGSGLNDDSAHRRQSRNWHAEHQQRRGCERHRLQQHGIAGTSFHRRRHRERQRRRLDVDQQEPALGRRIRAWAC